VAQSAVLGGAKYARRRDGCLASRLRAHLGMRRVPTIIAFVVIGLAIAIQAVPYGRSHSNPPVVAEPPWQTPHTRTLAVRACFDCHSNETSWPWYSNIAPVSWLFQHDVDEGRRALNLSEWNRPQKDAREAGETVRTGEMPPWIYSIRHASARLSATEKAALADGLDATLGSRRRPTDRTKND
jgi:Haem-binding domain